MKIKLKLKPIVALCACISAVVLTTLLLNVFCVTYIQEADGYPDYYTNILKLKPGTKVGEVDTFLTENYGDNYGGYFPYDNLATAKTNVDSAKEIPIFHISKNENFEYRSFNAFQDYFDYRDAYELLPVVVIGLENSGYRVNQKITLTMLSKDKSSSFEVNCVVIKKIALHNLPQYDVMDYLQLIDTYKVSFVVPDLYRDAVFGETDRYAFTVRNLNMPEKLRLERSLESYGAAISDIYSPSVWGVVNPLIVLVFSVFLSLVLLIFCAFLRFKFCCYHSGKKFDWWFPLHSVIIHLVSFFILLIISVFPIYDYIIINPLIFGLIIIFSLVMDAIIYTVMHFKNKKTVALQPRRTYEKI